MEPHETLDPLPAWPVTKRPSRLVLTARFAVLSAALLSAAFLLTYVMLWAAPEQPHLAGISVMFYVTTAVLAAGSFAMHRAVQWVRREKQPQFRSWLVIALGLGVLFTAFQSYGLADLIPSLRNALGGAANAAGFVAAIVAMHAFHVILAVLLLSMVTVQAFNDRYDHEYYWGVSFCAGFWHFLGLVWLSVLCVSVVAM